MYRTGHLPCHLIGFQTILLIIFRYLQKSLNVNGFGAAIIEFFSAIDCMTAVIYGLVYGYVQAFVHINNILGRSVTPIEDTAYPYIEGRASI